MSIYWPSEIRNENGAILVYTSTRVSDPYPKVKDSQSLLGQLCNIFLTVGVKILIIFRPHDDLKADTIEGWC